MSWLDKILPSRIRAHKDKKASVPEGLWHKCPNCDAVIYRAEFEKNLNVCPKCNHHGRISARKRADIILDANDKLEILNNITPVDMLNFKDKEKYKDKLISTQKKTGEKDAMLVFKGNINNIPVLACIFEYSFFGGSMGSVVGEKFTLAIKKCIEEKRPLICFSASGGARMQESLFSLFQMAKTSAVQKNLKRIKLVKKFAKKRAALKTIINNKKLDLSERFDAQLKLNKLPKNSAKIRIRNRCEVSGRPHGVYRKLKISRIALRDMASSGKIPGITKSSW